MASIVEKFKLRPDEFALYFEGDRGVEVDALTTFLKRVSTVANRNGGELRVVGLREGSLAVIIRTIANSKITKSAVKEFEEKPIDGTVKITGLVGVITGAIIYLMSPQKGADQPISKAGVEVVENHPVTQISIVTNVNTTVVMNKEIAAEMREMRRAAHRAMTGSRAEVPRLTEQRYLPRPVEDLVEDARLGNLTGEVDVVGRAAHFRPDGFHYWVPVYLSVDPGSIQLTPGHRYQVGGHIETLRGQPDRIVIKSADPIAD